MDRHELLHTLSNEERMNYMSYLDYVDEVIFDELLDAILTSITYLRMEMDNRFDNDAPVFEIKCELQEPNVVFFPSLDSTSKQGFMYLLESLIQDMYNIATLLYKVAQDPPEINEYVKDYYSKTYFILIEKMW